MESNHIDKLLSYISFTIEKEHFAISISKVVEIILLENITRVPNSSQYIEGILNFRGEIVPIINLKKRFNYNNLIGDGNLVIVVEVNHQDKIVQLGLLVNEVTDVIEFRFRDVKTIPEHGVKFNPLFLEGFVEIENQIVMVLEVDKVLSIIELAEVTNLVKENS